MQSQSMYGLNCYCEEESLKIKRLKGPQDKKIKKRYFLFNDTVRITPGNYILPVAFKRWHPIYQEFKVRPTDVWVISFPKSGTTWTQEMVWCILHKLDFEGAKTILTKRFPYFEYEGLIPRNLLWLIPRLEKGDPNIPGESWKIVNALPDPRTYKSHLHKELAPKGMWKIKPKIIYICRDPRDVCVSLYYHSLKYNGYKKDFSHFVDNFLSDSLLMFSPYWKHVLDYWEMRHEENVLFIRYEELKQDIAESVQSVADFLERRLTIDQISNLVDHLSFANMKNNEAVNNESILTFTYKRKSKKIKFMRKGKVGDWRTHLNAEQVEAFRKWTECNLQFSDFPYYRDYNT